jgi:hypothetical protein
LLSYDIYKWCYSIKIRNPRLTPVILATQEAETRRIIVQSQTRQTVHVTLSQKTLHKNRAGGVAQGVGPEFKTKQNNSSPSERLEACGQMHIMGPHVLQGSCGSPILSRPHIGWAARSAPHPTSWQLTQTLAAGPQKSQGSGSVLTLSPGCRASEEEPHLREGGRRQCVSAQLGLQDC